MANNNKGKGTAEQALVKSKRLVRLSEMMLCGHTSQSELAAMLGVSRQTVSDYMKEVTEKWVRSWSKSFRQRHMLRVRMLEKCLTWCATAWESSRQSETEVRTVIGRERCGSCRGTGMAGDEWCVNCDGEGAVETETTTTTVRGTSGDPAFLRLFKDIVAETAKLENLYRGTNMRPRPQIFDGILKRVDAGDWAGASAEDILRAKALLEDLKNGSGGRIIDARVIEPNEIEE